MKELNPQSGSGKSYSLLPARALQRARSSAAVVSFDGAVSSFTKHKLVLRLQRRGEADGCPLAEWLHQLGLAHMFPERN